VKRFIVITTIHEKTCGIRKFEAFPDWHLVVVGDQKTPQYKDTDNLTYLSIEKQQEMGFRIAGQLPFNHYCRKNIGYLYAISQGADIIYDTDDDNIPYDDWSFEAFSCENKLQSKDRFANVYRYFTDKPVWPRGFPLERITAEKAPPSFEKSDTRPIAVWQGLADRDPDVDAIYRLVYGELLDFENRPSVYLDRHIYCPFNSQNTLWNRIAFALMYLPVTVSFRFTDILRGYIAQRLFWAADHHLGFCRATVYQERNVHDLLSDFRDEIECYLNVPEVVEVLDNIDLVGELDRMLLAIYQGLAAAGLVQPEELGLVDTWLDDVTRALDGGRNG